MKTRPVGNAEDIRACVALFYEAFNDLHAQRGLPAEDPEEDAWIVAALTDLARTDPGLFRLAEDGEGPAAFGSAYRRGNYWFLSFLFVAPRAQGRGIGRGLLEGLLPPAEEREECVLATVVESTQPVSTALYASYGMAPRTPLYDLGEIARPDALPALPPGVRRSPLTNELLDACVELDRSLLGYGRAQDLSAWTERFTATAYITDEGTLLGYGLVDDNWLAPIASGGQLLSAAILRDLLERVETPAKAKFSILGWSGALMQTCLHAGMRIDPARSPFVYCSTSGRRPDPAYLPFAPFQL